MEKSYNYPKVCYGCSHPHIRCDADEVLSEDGNKSYHKDCYKETEVVEPLEIKSENEEELA